MKVIKVFSFLFILACLPLHAQVAKGNPSEGALPRPKLVVGIVVDQMRWDYLYRYYQRYQKDGFKRLLNEGFSCENTMLNYIPTYTAIGHSTIYSGSVPAISGIAGNNFIIQATGKSMYCTDDDSVTSVGSDSDAGKMSPKNLLVSTVTDELRLATNFHSKVIGVALKDRASILPAGHAANAAYWFDDKAGKFISSTYYMTQLPGWVNEFNKKNLAEKYLKQDWNTLYPIESYTQSCPDDNSYEGKFKGTSAPVLPVRTSELYKEAGLGLIRNTPYGNSLTLDMAKAALDGEALGQGEYTDFLAVSFSSPDYIGHQFGPNSVEVEDTYLRLDKNIATLLHYLDQKVGKGNYAVFLTADHGAAHNVGFLTDHKIPAGAWNEKDIIKGLNTLLQQKYNVADLVLSAMNYQIHFNNETIAANHLNVEDLKPICIDFLNKKEGVAWAVDMNKVNEANLPQAVRERTMNGYNRERSGVIQVIMKPGFYESSSLHPTGTTHGTWNPYDAHIPLVWMGWGINHGASRKSVNMTDIAPTVAALLHIQMPNGCIGEPIVDVLK